MEQAQYLSANNTMLPLSMIDDLPFGNSRRSRNEAKYNEMKNSVMKRGVIQPVLVRPAADRFEIVAGYGRLSASRELGLTEIPVLIKPLSDAEALEHQIEENVNRESLSIIDECKAVQQLSAFYNGDRQAIADRLVWSSKKVNERIEILKCCEEVLDAVQVGSITVGHALLLAPFSTKLQQGTLKKIIAEKWTVSYLRQRASKGQQYLTLAKFDTQDCNSCQHNSEAQSGLFGLDSHKAACSNISCFKEKTNQWLETRKAELSEQYGTVLLVQQINEADRNSVDALTVGETQFLTGCQACEKRVVLIDDRLGRSLGSTIDNQCIDQICFNKCIEALTTTPPLVSSVSEKNNEELPESSVTTEKAAPPKGASSKTKTTNKPVSCAVPKKVVETNKAILRETSAELLMPNEHFQLAMNYAALKRLCTGYKAINSELASPTHFEETIKSALRVSVEELKAEIINATLHLATKQDAQNFSMTDIMINCMSFADNARQVAVAKWNPTKALLAEYTVGSLTALCIKAGLDTAMNNHEAGSFNKAAASGKGKFIDTIIATEFDWSDFAPDEYLALIK
ncbi:PRTRC system ParB family protein [Shewanella algicola]|uniref:PRTRC system ParB family protein n=1 Tax=Shewanella algicola TaxID=640633 RepID=UPI0024946B02|nr:PRTRC system ParB family protein [Shewanella algicola]